MDSLNGCDHDHMTTEETRYLPTGGGGGIIICHRHYEHEMRFRRERIAAGVEFDLPDWGNLEIHAERTR
jgi:hypothetical protein